MDNIERLRSNLSKIEGASQDIRKFVEKIADHKSIVETDVFAAGSSFLDGTDALGEGVVTGYATINDRPVYFFAQNFEVMKGGLSVRQADKIKKAIKMSLKTGVPFVSIINSAGARVGEGVSVLEGYAGIIKAATELSGNVPHFAVVKGACVGLMSAYAALADFLFIDDKDGYISLNSPMAVAAEADSGLKAAELLGAELLKGNGMITSTYSTPEDLRGKISAIFDVIAGSAAVDNANRSAAVLNKDKSLANLLAALCDDGKYIELAPAATKCIFTALALVNGRGVGILATRSDDGLMGEGGLKKASEFVALLDRLDLPLITLVNATGIKSGVESEKEGIARAAAELLVNIGSASIDKVAVITGSAVGYAYAALASKSMGFDYVLAFADAVIAPLSAKTAVGFMYGDEIAASSDAAAARAKLTATYTEREGNPFISAKDGYVDNIIEPSALRPYVCSILNMLE